MNKPDVMIPAEISTPVSEHNNCVYLAMRPSTPRYHKLMDKAQDMGMTWQEVARLAIDWYLNKYPPLKRSKRTVDNPTQRVITS